MQPRCDRWGRKWDTGRGETGENDSGKYGTAGPLPLGRTQPQQAPSFVEGRRENGRGRGQAARRTYSTAPGGAGNGTPGEVQRGFRDRWGWKWDTGRGWRGISGQVELEMGHRERLEDGWAGILRQVGRKVGHRARLADLRGRLRGEALDREGRWGRRVRRLIRCESMKVVGGR